MARRRGDVAETQKPYANGDAAAAASRLAEGAELGQRLWPLVPVLCAAAATPAGGEDGALALGALREM